MTLVPDNYSNDDGLDKNIKQQNVAEVGDGGGGQVFAHPMMVGKRRRSTVGLPKQAQ